METPTNSFVDSLLEKLIVTQPIKIFHTLWYPLAHYHVLNGQAVSVQPRSQSLAPYSITILSSYQIISKSLPWDFLILFVWSAWYCNPFGRNFLLSHAFIKSFNCSLKYTIFEAPSCVRFVFSSHCHFRWKYLYQGVCNIILTAHFPCLVRCPFLAALYPPFSLYLDFTLISCYLTWT